MLKIFAFFCAISALLHFVFDINILLVVSCIFVLTIVAIVAISNSGGSAIDFDTDD